MATKLIPFDVDTNRVIELLSSQIYQSAFALLRENAQNAYDAILMRARRQCEEFSPHIEISLEPEQVKVVDNGVGMTPDEVRDNYWRAGHSGKNTEEARAAGVVGTFGIGAMANFGIAGELIVETESATTGERCRSRAVRDRLAIGKECVELQNLESQGKPGTSVIANILSRNRIDVRSAVGYIEEFVQLLEMPVVVNGKCVSAVEIGTVVPAPVVSSQFEEVGCQLGRRLTADAVMVVSSNADIWLDMRNIVWSGIAIPGRVTLRSGEARLRTCRSGFGLATVGIGSFYQFGGVADLASLEPTAGREALTTDGMQLLQSLIQEVDGFVSAKIADMPECHSSTPFMSWVVATRSYGVCGRLRVLIQPGDRRMELNDVKKRSSAEGRMLVFGGGRSGRHETTRYGRSAGHSFGPQ